MFNHRGNRRPLTAQVAGALLFAAAASVSLVGCESPLRTTDDTMGNYSYSQSLLARALVNGDDASHFVGPITIDGGVQELARVDDNGTGGGPTATQPATTRPSLATVSVIGMPQAALNMPEPVFALSKADAIARAVNHSLNIRVEGQNPGIKESVLIQAEAAFDPVVFGGSQWSTTDQPTSLVPTATNGQSWLNQIGIKKLLPSGATVSAFTSTTYQDLPSNIQDGFNHISNTSTLNLQISQPLLRGFGTDYTEANIFLAQRDLRISLTDFKKQVLATVGDVEEAYDNLVLARTTVEIFERLVVSSEQTYRLIEARGPLDATKASINQALYSLETHRADLNNAQSSYRQASDQLKSLMNDPELSINSNVLINPLDRPIAEPVYYNVAECIERALQQRPELQEQRLNIEKSNIQVQIARNDLLPQLSLVAGMQTTGVDKSFERSYKSTIDPMNSIDWNAGVQLQFPLGNRAAEGEMRQREGERNQAILQMMNLADQIVNDVKNRLHDVMKYYLQIVILDRARIAAAAAFEGIIQIEDIRARTPEFLQLKLDYQQNLANAEQALSQAIVNYNIAIERVERAKGTLLEYDRISMDRPPANPADNDLGKRFFMDHSSMPPPKKDPLIKLPDWPFKQP